MTARPAVQQAPREADAAQGENGAGEVPGVEGLRLKIDSVLGNLPGHDLTVESDTPVERIEELFAAHPTLPGILLSRSGRHAGMVPRGRFTECLARPLGREFYAGRPIAQMVSTERMQALRLDSNDRLEMAAQIALLRPGGQSYEPVVVAFPDGRHCVLDMQVILLQLARFYDIATSQNRGLLENVQAYAARLESTLDELRREGHLPDGPTRPEVNEAVLRALTAADPLELATAMDNDLQTPAVVLFPELSDVLELGMDEGALRGMVSGSGPTLLFVAQDEASALRLASAIEERTGVRALPVHGPVPGAHVL